MNKVALAGGLGALIVFGACGGGYVYVDSQVKEAIRSTLETKLPENSAIKSIAYDSYQVSLLSNSASVQNLRLSIDMATLAEAAELKLPGLSVSGTMDLTYDTVSAHGIRGLALGATTLDRVDFSPSTLKGRLIETLQKPDSVKINDEEQVRPDAPVKSATISMTFDGALGAGTVSGLDVAPFMNAKTLPLMLTMGSFQAQDMQLKAVVDTTIEQETSEPPKVVPAFDIDLTVKTIRGRNISPATIGLFRYEDSTMSVTPKSGEQGPLKMNIGSWAMSDVILNDYRPVRFTLDIQDLTVDAPTKAAPPQAKLFMSMLGIDAVNLNMQMSYDFNEDRKTLRVNPFRLGLKQAGTVDLAFAVEGMPKQDVFEKISALGEDREKINAALQDAFKDVALDEVSVGYADEGILKKFIAMQAEQFGVEPKDIAEGYAAQPLDFITQAFGAEKAEELKPVFLAFLTDPDAIRVRLKAKLPVKVKDLMAEARRQGLGALSYYQISVKSGEEAQFN